MVVKFIIQNSRIEPVKTVEKNIDASAVEIGRSVILGHKNYFVKHISLDADSPAMLVNLSEER